jgi:hypothetical protein
MGIPADERIFRANPVSRPFHREAGDLNFAWSSPAVRKMHGNPEKTAGKAEEEREAISRTNWAGVAIFARWSRGSVPSHAACAFARQGALRAGPRLVL